MITAAVSALLGIFGGLVPDLFKEFRAGREHKRELEMLTAQSDLQLKLLDRQSDMKLAEIDANAAAEEMRAFRAQMLAIYEQQRPIGVKWVDAFNAALRPSAVTLIMLLFVATAGFYIYGVMLDWLNPAKQMGARLAAETVWGSLIGESIQAVLGYLFGYRSAIKLRERVAQ